MARIALIGPSPALAAAVAAAARGHDLRECAAGAIPADADLAILEAAGRRDEIPHPACPLLLILDPGSEPRLPLQRGTAVKVLRKPFEIFELRLKIAELLAGSTDESTDDSEPSSGPAPTSHAASWLVPPLVQASQAHVLEAARRLRGCVWIVGEAGTGREQVAAALAAAWDAHRDPVPWEDGSTLESVAARLDDPDRVLLVPGIESRSAREQRAFEALMARQPARRAIAVSDDDPASAVAAGGLERSLYHLLSRVALRLPPLRERSSDDIVALVDVFASRVAQALSPGLGVEWTAEARALLASWSWPGNLLELDAVVTRSVVARLARADSAPATAGPRSLLLEASDLVLEAPLGPGAAPDPSASSSSPAYAVAREPAVRGASPAEVPTPRAVVVPFTPPARAMEAARTTETTVVASASTPNVADASLARRGPSGVEPVLAAFAHDLRNPLSTVKTFVAMSAAQEAGGEEDALAELARLAGEAVERMDGHFEILQRWSDLHPQSPTRFDLVEVLVDAIEAAEAGASMHVAARRALPVDADRGLAAFVADVLVEECRQRPGGGDQASVDVLADGSALVVGIPLGGNAADGLAKWVEGEQLPWRLALAREAAARGGGTMDIETGDGQRLVRWSPAPATQRLPLPTEDVEVDVEEGRDGNPTGGADRRRRSRSS